MQTDRARRNQGDEMAIFAFFIPFTLWQDANSTRHAKLIVGFGTLGAVSGLLYATFYVAIGHLWGAAVIAVCSIAIAGVPWMLRQTSRVDFAGNADALILTVGFTLLSAIEGGLRRACRRMAGVGAPLRPSACRKACWDNLGGDLLPHHPHIRRTRVP